MKSDTDLKRQVLARLECNPGLDAGALGVSAAHGVVTLQGWLHDPAERAAAERTVKLVPGVKGLVDRVRVELPETESPSDAEIAAAASEAIRWLTTVPFESVSLSVQGGWVTLEGTVESWHQSDTLEDLMRHLPQTKGLNNRLKVRSGSARTHRLKAV
jgi:osmotically-inducible protein OsmY